VATGSLSIYENTYFKFLSEEKKKLVSRVVNKNPAYIPTLSPQAT